MIVIILCRRMLCALLPPIYFHPDPPTMAILPTCLAHTSDPKPTMLRRFGIGLCIPIYISSAKRGDLVITTNALKGSFPLYLLILYHFNFVDMSLILYLYKVFFSVSHGDPIIL